MSNGVSEKLFAKSSLGWISLGMGAILIASFIFTLVNILPALVTPPGFVEKRLETDKNMNIAYVATLEYESYSIRTQATQIALGFLVGMFLSAFGMVLFAIGAGGAFEASGASGTATMSLKSTAPGLIVLIISGMILCFSVTKDIHRSFEATYEHSGSDSIKTKPIINKSPFFPPPIAPEKEGKNN